MKVLSSIKKFFPDSISSRSVKERIFIYSMFIFAILSFIVTVSNIVNGLDLSYIYKWILICFVSFLFIVLALKGKNVSAVHRIAVYIFVWGILPLSGFTSAGLVGPSLSYTFLLLIFVSYLMHGWERIVLVFSVIFINLVITVSFMKFPEIFQTMDAQEQDFDWLVTVPVVSIFMSFLLIVFERAYEKERKLHKDKTERLKELSFTDFLTGLYNRVHMEEKLSLVHNIYARTGAPYTVIMIDIDFFKRYNDIYGHPAGDEVLKKFSIILKNRITRNTDWAYRYGGEEFLILLGFSDETAALVVAEEIQKDLKKEYIPHEASHIKPYLTVSMGIAAVDNTAADPKDVIKLADDALYQSKNRGRDLITLHECRGSTKK